MYRKNVDLNTLSSLPRTQNHIKIQTPVKNQTNIILHYCLEMYIQDLEPKTFIKIHYFSTVRLNKLLPNLDH